MLDWLLKSSLQKSVIYFFIIIYLIASIALWSFVSLFNCFRTSTANFYLKEVSSLYLSTLSNYVKYNKGWSFCLLIIFASMAGIPPFSGFLSKVFVFIALTENSKWFINMALVMLSCIIIWYYINVITILFMEVKSKFVKSKDTEDNFDSLCLEYGADKIYINQKHTCKIMLMPVVGPYYNDEYLSKFKSNI